MDIKEIDSLPCIRFVTERDLDRILEIERLSFPSPHQWNYYDFKAALKDLFFVFEEKEKILGFLIACCYEGEDRAIIMRIAVDPEYRGKGIATMLIEVTLETLRKMNIGEVELDVEIVRTGAIKLYEKIGFKIVKPLHMNNEENEDFYIMKLKLDIERREAA